MMAFKFIMTGLASFNVGLILGILIIYFFGGRSFFKLMKIDRRNLCAEMESNTKEIHDEVDRRAAAELQHGLLENKGDGSDE